MMKASRIRFSNSGNGARPARADARLKRGQGGDCAGGDGGSLDHDGGIETFGA